MSLRIRFPYPPDATLGYSIERLSDGLVYDFADGTFKASPATLIAALPADLDTGNFSGRYKVTLATTPKGQFSDGDYTVTIHNTADGNGVVSELAATMFNGDDQTPSPLAVWGRIIDGYTAAQILGILGSAIAGRWRLDLDNRYHFAALDGSADRLSVAPGTDARSVTILPGS